MSSSSRRQAHSGFDLARQLSIFVALVGVVFLVSHLVGQIRIGSAPGWTLIAGAACLLAGSIFALLFLIRLRLDRIEAKLPEGGSSSNSPKESVAE